MTWVLIDVPFAKGKFLDLRYPVVMGLIIVFSLARGYVSKVFSNKILVHLGNISLCIYMFHSIVLHFFPKMIGGMPEWSAIVLTYGLVLLGSDILTRYYLPIGISLFGRIVK